MDFETLCFNLYGIKKPFKKDGSLSVAGAKVYGKLILLMYDLKSMNVISKTDPIIKRLDKCIDMNQNATRTK